MLRTPFLTDLDSRAASRDRVTRSASNKSGRGWAGDDRQRLGPRLHHDVAGLLLLRISRTSLGQERSSPLSEVRATCCARRGAVNADWVFRGTGELVMRPARAFVQPRVRLGYYATAVAATSIEWIRLVASQDGVSHPGTPSWCGSGVPVCSLQLDQLSGEGWHAHS